MQISGKVVKYDYENATIELSPRELLEQLTHKQIGELLDEINLPQPAKEEKSCKCKPDRKGQLPATPEGLCGKCGKPIKELSIKIPEPLDLNKIRWGTDKQIVDIINALIFAVEQIAGIMGRKEYNG